MPKETLETFINKANQIHENKYDYTNVILLFIVIIL